MLGYDGIEAAGLRLADLVQPDVYWRLRETMEQAERGGKPALKLALRKKDGSALSALVRLRQVDSADGQAILIVFHDAGEQGAQARGGDGTQG